MIRRRMESMKMGANLGEDGGERNNCKDTGKNH